MKLFGRVSGPLAMFFSALCGVLSVNLIITGKSNHDG
jgi:hypothetical protein